MIPELLPPETGLAFEAMRALRTAYADEQSFVQRVDEIQRSEGYRLVGAFEDEGAAAVAVAGSAPATLSPGVTTSTSTTSPLTQTTAAEATPAPCSIGYYRRQSDSTAISSTSTQASNWTEPTLTVYT